MVSRSAAQKDDECTVTIVFGTGADGAGEGDGVPEVTPKTAPARSMLKTTFDLAFCRSATDRNLEISGDFTVPFARLANP